MKSTDVTIEIVDAIVADLDARKGLGFDTIDVNIQKSIKAAWCAIVRRHLTVERDL